MPRSFLYVVLVVFAAVASAFSYRLYQDSQNRSSTVGRHEQPGPFAEGRPAENVPSTQPLRLVE